MKSVPYDTNDMKFVDTEIMSCVQKCNDESYNITVYDVIDAATHLKDGLSSDHFIDGNRHLCVLLSILFTLFSILRHGFSPYF